MNRWFIFFITFVVCVALYQGYSDDVLKIRKNCNTCNDNQIDQECKLPAYQPERWNVPGNIKKSNNCYSYAFRDLDPHRSHRMGVGEEVGLGKIKAENYSCSTFEDNMFFERDGVQKSTKSGVCPCNSYKISLFLDSNNDSKDFHFYRQDNNDKWSHKIGGLDATNKDASGNIISDPLDADRNYTRFNKNYDELCGYYCVPYTD